MIELKKVGKTYDNGRPLEVLRNVDLHVPRGQYTAIVGPSGSGKSTLLHIMGLIHPSSCGEVLVGGVNTSSMDDADRSRFRGARLGFVFQSFHLVPHLTVLENVELPLFYQRIPQKERRARAEEVLAQVGLSDRLTHAPRQLSGGECQRTAVARALVTEADLLMADEPTGNLDQRTGQQILDLLEGLREHGKTLVVITHDASLAARMDRCITLRDGEIEEDSGA